MNLVIDQGNTNVKFAVFSDGDIIERRTEGELGIETISKLLKDFPEISRSILSSSGRYSEEIPDYLTLSVPDFIILNSMTPLPIVNNYQTKGTLGYDRIADAVGAHTIFPANNVLVVDAGTAITFDLVTSTGVYMGGNISPGLDLRFKALNLFTEKLPLVEKSRNFSLLGKNTHEAILSGVLNAVVFEIDGYISELKEIYSDLKVVLTGGDINFFVKNLKNIIFVDSNLNLTGLNRILEFNGK